MKTEKEIKEYMKTLKKEQKRYVKELADSPEEALILDVQIETLGWVIE